MNKLDRIQTLENELAALKADIKRDDKKGVWKPEVDKGYYYLIGSLRSVDFDTNDGVDIDRKRIATGNYFKTKEIAQAHVTNLKIHQRLKELAKGYEFDPQISDNYRFVYCHHRAAWRSDYDNKYQARGVYFSDATDMHKVAKTIIKEFSEEELNRYLQS